MNHCFPRAPGFAAALFATCLLLAGCSTTDPTSDRSMDDPLAFNKPPTARITVSPASGTNRTLFTFDAGATTDEETPDQLLYAMDWNGDGWLDSPLSASPVMQFTLDPGMLHPLLWVMDPQEAWSSCALDLAVDTDLRELDILAGAEVWVWEQPNPLFCDLEVLLDVQIHNPGTWRFENLTVIGFWLVGETDTLLSGQLHDPGFRVDYGDCVVYPGGEVTATSHFDLSRQPSTNWPCTTESRGGLRLAGGNLGQVLDLEFQPGTFTCIPAIP